MIENIDVLLVVSYLERINNPQLSLDEREYLRLQLESIDLQTESDQDSTRLSNALRAYIALWDGAVDSEIIGSLALQRAQIPLLAHRWFWQRITDSDVYLSRQRPSRDQFVQAYFELKDPFIRYWIVNYFIRNESLTLPRDELPIVRRILRLIPFEQERLVLTIPEDMHELLDILFDIQISSDDPEQILSFILDWLQETSDNLRNVLRVFMRLRTMYLIGQTGQQIRDILNLDNER
jgi:hypothetical protein